MNHINGFLESMLSRTLTVNERLGEDVPVEGVSESAMKQKSYAEELCRRFGDDLWADITGDERAWWCAHARELLEMAS